MSRIVEDIEKTIQEIEAVDFAEECYEGYEDQAEDNQECVLLCLYDALEAAKAGDCVSWELSEAARLERRGGFVATYTGALSEKYKGE